jgi:hypothetical protein
MPSASLGTYKIQCLKVGGLSLSGYGAFSFEENEVVNLLDPSLSDSIKCSDWETADVMCRDLGLEIAQCIQRGDLVVVEVTPPGTGPLGM